MRPNAQGSPPRYLSLAIGGGCGPALAGVVVFSAVINVLYLTGSFYMLQVYDRVIPSRSVPTLLALSFLAVCLYAAQALLDVLRARILARAARVVDEKLSPRVFAIVAATPLTRRGSAASPRPLQDLDQVRAFFSSGGPLGFLDLPWVPVYLAVCFLFHPTIGFAALAGAIFLGVLTICSEMLTRAPMRAAAAEGALRAGLADATRRNAEVVAALGMTQAIWTMWNEANRKLLDANDRAGDVAGGFGGVSKAARMALQSGVLGIGAYLVIGGEASTGIIIAASILSARALAPVEQVIAGWRSFISARQSWARLRLVLAQAPEQGPRVQLRDPRESFCAENVTVKPPGAATPAVREVSFRLRAGSVLGVVGPSASGKSSLGRALVGVWKPERGCVRLDGATLDQWAPELLGPHIGYLPQDIELFEGSIGQNISRFATPENSEAIVRAAEQAGVHETIIRLPDGYNTMIGEAGLSLSGGQRQRIALARALYNDPFLIVLDEPNSNLDAEGEEALRSAISRARDRGAIVIVITHRSSALAIVDHVLVLQEGRVVRCGPKEEVIRRVVHAVQA